MTKLHLRRRFRNALTEARDTYKEFTFKDWEQCAAYHETPTGYYFEEPRFPRLRYAWDLLNEVRKSIVCGFLGHDLVDRSTAGPDSGNMDHECRRCGRYWHVPLY